MSEERQLWIGLSTHTTRSCGIELKHVEMEEAKHVLLKNLKQETPSEYGQISQVSITEDGAKGIVKAKERTGERVDCVKNTDGDDPISMNQMISLMQNLMQDVARRDDIATRASAR